MPPVIQEVATSITAFVGRSERGPLYVPTAVASVTEYEAVFGSGSFLSDAVRGFFENGGTDARVIRVSRNGHRRGIRALAQLDLFNLLCVVPEPGQAIAASVWNAAVEECRKRRALLIADVPESWTMGAALPLTPTPDAAVYFPWLRVRDQRTVPPCGAVAGVFARTDAGRGVWKAPAGSQAMLAGVVGLAAAVNDSDSAQLQSMGINPLRSFPVMGNVVWGARTLAGADSNSHEYKYVPVRRLALFVEESLARGLVWTVFEPNDERLWSEIRRTVNAFLTTIWSQGGLMGATAGHAFFVRCDSTTTTQADIDQGFLNVLVGVAPLKPAEFIHLLIRQSAAPPKP